MLATVQLSRWVTGLEGFELEKSLGWKVSTWALLVVAQVLAWALPDLAREVLVSACALKV